MQEKNCYNLNCLKSKALNLKRTGATNENVYIKVILPLTTSLCDHYIHITDGHLKSCF